LVADILPAPARRQPKAERLKHGVPLPDDVWATIVAAARSVGVNGTAIAEATR